MSLKDEIYTLIKERNHVTFIELSEIDGVKGDLVYGLIERNIIFWVNMSEEAIDAIQELLYEERVFFEPATQMTYLLDGGGLKLPIAKRKLSYKSKRWLPLCLTTNCP